MIAKHARSYLFVPGSRPERFERACSAGADAVIVDLEDAVPPPDKEAASAALAGWLKPERPVLVRINGVDTPWHEADLALCRRPGVAGIVLPKAERIDRNLIDLCEETRLRLYPLIETAEGLMVARELAQCPVVERLIFGSIDFQVDLGIEGEGEELLYFRSQIVLASRLARVAPPVDGVCTEIDEPEQLQADTLRAKRMGFGAKLCVHPRQVPLVNACFSPTPEEVAWAEKVIEAATRSDGAPVAVDGRMVDRPVILQARRIMELERVRKAR